MSHETIINSLQEAVSRLCGDCRNGVPFNVAGSHGFDIHARPCKAERLRKAIAELEAAGNPPQEKIVMATAGIQTIARLSANEIADLQKKNAELQAALNGIASLPAYGHLGVMRTHRTGDRWVKKSDIDRLALPE